MSSSPSSESTASSGRCSASSAHQQLVGGAVAGVLELAALEALAAHLEQPLARPARPAQAAKRVVVGVAGGGPGESRGHASRSGRLTLDATRLRS